MIGKWGRASVGDCVSTIFSLALLAAIWSGLIVLVGAVFRLAALLFCIGFRC